MYSIILEAIDNTGNTVYSTCEQCVSILEMEAIRADFMVRTNRDIQIVRVTIDIALPVS